MARSQVRVHQPLGDIRAIFLDACLQVGVRSTTSGLTVYVSRQDDVKLLDAHGCAKG